MDKNMHYSLPKRWLHFVNRILVNNSKINEVTETKFWRVAQIGSLILDTPMAKPLKVFGDITTAGKFILFSPMIRS